YRGKVVTIFFGFTQCPDVCPTTLTDMMEVKKGLGDQASQLQVLFATVDPERDTQDVLANYIAAFDPSFVALRGNPEQTAALIKAFNLVVQKVPGPTATSYTINHSTGTYIFDPQGRVRLYVPHGADPASIAADIEKLL
ncbi:MAG TPA: SCO family protein, partial [Burkholderiaceae bacterium]|nr:SCO family protein [Burkholderiaceae bacterium]